ncbi:MAG: hypothetical protein V3V42_02685 [Candidatus Omnitrophota bacterium]
MKYTIRHKRGFILFSIVLISCISILLVIPLITWPINEYSWTIRSFKSLKALNLADAGAELAVWEIVHNGAQFTGWTGGNPKALNLTSFTDNAGGLVGDIAIDLEETSPDNYLITSAGLVSFSNNVTIGKTVKGKVFPRALFSNGIFGYGSVTVSGNTLIDSYNSSEGPYSPSTAGSNGDVGTNGTLTLADNAMLNSDVFIGPNGSVSGDLSAHVTGETYYSGNDVELYDPPFDEAYFISLPSQGNLVVTGMDNYIIHPGDYRYESIIVEGQASLTIRANTRLYVHNDFYVTGQAVVYTEQAVEIYLGGNGDFAGQGIVNTGSDPKDLQIYGVRNGTDLRFTGINDFYGTIFASGSDIYMAGNAGYYGAVVGGNVTLAGNAQLHYDEILLSSGPFKGYNIAYWQED